MATPTKTELRKIVGRGKFTVADYADKTGLSVLSVRKHISTLVETGAVEVVGKVETGKRGRPARLYRVTPGADTPAPEPAPVAAE